MASTIPTMPEIDFLLECEWWTQALLSHFVEGVRPGAPVFLSIDEEVLTRIGQAKDRSADDFLQMIRRRWVRRFRRSGENNVHIKVTLDTNRLRSGGDCREYVTFLAATVLAAQWMENEVLEDFVIDEQNYFQRLREVLGLEWKNEHGRPQGLKNYDEWWAWIWWKDWVRSQGREPTAHPGKKGTAHRYISFPLSQTLLRDGDRNRLATWFWQEARTDDRVRALDRETLLGWMLAHHSRLQMPRLWRILDRPQDSLRFEATVDAAFDVYASVDWDQEPTASREAGTRPARRLTAGLYREEDPFLGEVCYCYYLPQPAEPVEAALTVRLDDDSIQLRPDRVGWFSPLPWPRRHVPPPSAVTMQMEGHPTIREVIFPQRDFWILIADPLSGGGAHATWGPAVPDQPFILLCRASLDPILKTLRELGVVEWRETQVEPMEGQWYEIRGCRIQPSGWQVHWSGLKPHEEALVRALRPRTKGSIEFNGGLPAPDRREGWMQDYLPSIRIQAGRGRGWVKVTDLQSQVEILQQQVSISEDVLLPASLKPGYYRVEAARLKDGDDESPSQVLPPRILSVRDWETLECAGAVGGMRE